MNSNPLPDAPCQPPAPAANNVPKLPNFDGAAAPTIRSIAPDATDDPEHMLGLA